MSCHHVMFHYGPNLHDLVSVPKVCYPMLADQSMPEIRRLLHSKLPTPENLDASNAL